jgi:hypothetical protein
MPASLFHEMDRSNGDHGLEDQRALQLAFELSMLGLSGSHSAADQQEQMNPAYADDARSKKSQNMTECVPVPSSEHVAEIVGRQGKKTRPRGHTLVVLSVRNTSIRRPWRARYGTCTSPCSHVHGLLGGKHDPAVDLFVESSKGCLPFQFWRSPLAHEFSRSIPLFSVRRLSHYLDRQDFPASPHYLVLAITKSLFPLIKTGFC